MQEPETTRAAPMIRVATLIVLLGVLAGWAQAYGYPSAPATNWPVGAECWSVRGRPWMTCDQQESEPFALGGTSSWGLAEMRAPMWAAPLHVPTPTVALAPRWPTDGWEHPVPSSTLRPTVPRLSHVALLGPEPWYVLRPYARGRVEAGYDPYPCAGIREWPFGAIPCESRYR